MSTTTSINDQNVNAQPCSQTTDDVLSENSQATASPAAPGTTAQDTYRLLCREDDFAASEKKSKPFFQSLFATLSKVRDVSDEVMVFTLDGMFISGFKSFLPPQTQDQVGCFLQSNADVLPFPLNVAADELGKWLSGTEIAVESVNPGMINAGAAEAE